MIFQCYLKLLVCIFGRGGRVPTKETLKWANHAVDDCPPLPAIHFSGKVDLRNFLALVWIDQLGGSLWLVMQIYAPHRVICLVGRNFPCLQAAENGGLNYGYPAIPTKIPAMVIVCLFWQRIRKQTLPTNTWKFTGDGFLSFFFFLTFLTIDFFSINRNNSRVKTLRHLPVTPLYCTWDVIFVHWVAICMSYFILCL